MWVFFFFFLFSFWGSILGWRLNETLNSDIPRLKIAAIIEDSIDHVRALEVIEFLCEESNSTRIDLVFETHNLTSGHPAFMDGQVEPLLGKNVSCILWIVTCETLDFLPAKLRPLELPSLLITIEVCPPLKPIENTDYRSIALSEVIERLEWPDVNIIYDDSIRSLSLLSLIKELSVRFIKASLYLINRNSSDSDTNLLKRFISLNQKSYSQNQFLVVLRNESLGEVLQLASILMMLTGKLYWILANDNLEANSLPNFGVNPRNANVLLFKKACDGDRKNIQNLKELMGDLQQMLPNQSEYILTLICMIVKSLKGKEAPDLKSLASCTNDPFESLTNIFGILLPSVSASSNSCYPAFEVSTIHEGFAGSISSTVARWRPDRKLIVRKEFFPNRKFGLGNVTIRVSTLPLPPYTIRSSSEKETNFEGFAVKILQELSRQMNFSYEWKEPEDKQFGVLINGTFTGLVGLLERREVDLVIGALTVSYARSLVVDYTYPYTEEGRGMLIKKPTESSRFDLFRVFRAFQPVTWVSFGVVIIVVAIMLTIIDGFKKMSDSYNTVRGLPDNRTARNRCLFSHLSWKETMWSIYAMHLFQAGAHEPTSTRSRVIIICWWLFTILVSTYYTANLTAHFTIVDQPSTIETLSDLANDYSVVPLTLEGSAIYDEFRVSKNPVKQKIFKRLQMAPRIKSAEESLDMVKTGKYICISLWSEVKTLAAQNCEDLMVPGKPYGIKTIGFALPRGSALTAEISTKLGIMREAGLVEKWRLSWWKEKASCSQSRNQKPKTLDMQSLGGVYIVFVGFTFVSCLLLAVEIMNYNKRKRISLDDVTRN